ncbi:glycosyltransferase [Runella limosa]|uniref:glycosyltransferase n=1 Tax=Runella limosa TaxID=370978 RepID=UPI000428AD85|nr:glycosyltransferase [Runella limosa]
MKKQKILHVIHGLTIGGVETAILSSFNDLNNDFDYNVFCIGNVDTSILTTIRSENLKKIKKIGRIKDVFFILKFIKDNPDIILVSSLWKAHAIHFFFKKIYNFQKSVIFLHSTRFAHLFDKYCTLLSLKIANEIWVDSDSASSFINPFISKPIPIIKISFLLNHSLKIKPISIISTHVKFISLGRLAPLKRIDLSILFIKELRSKGIDAYLDIYGPDNGFLNQILSLIRQSDLNNIVNYKGICDISEVESTLAQYDAFILMSDYEGMSISTVQAMEIGLLCFLRNVGEITNYGNNMSNSIILQSDKPQHWQKFINDSMEVLSNQSLQKSILIKSKQEFKDLLTYSQDIKKNFFRLIPLH